MTMLHKHLKKIFFIGVLITSTNISAEQNNNSDNQTPHRIITIAPNAAEIICSLGACDSIVGVSEYCVFPPELKKRTKIGGFINPDLERIVALQPDLIVLRGQNDSIEKLCREMNIAIYQDLTDKTLSGIETCIMDLGRLLNKETRASSLVQQFRDSLDAIRSRVAHRSRPRVFLTIFRSPDKLSNILTSGNGTFLHEMIEIAGGENIFGHIDMAYPQITPESILARQPDVIIELRPGENMTHELKEKLYRQWSRLGSVPAVTNKKIYFITDDHAQIPSPRYVKIIEKISRLLHPESYDKP